MIATNYIKVTMIRVMYRNCLLKVRKTQEGGWIMFSFSSFSPTEVTGQKQLDYNFWSDVQILNAADKNRDRERER